VPKAQPVVRRGRLSYRAAVTTSRPRQGSGTLASLGWARLLLLAAILAGVFVMHTAGYAEDAVGGTHAAVAPQHADGHVQTAHGGHALFSGDAAAASVHAGPAAGSHGTEPFGCELTSMCLGLLAGATVLLVLHRIRTSKAARSPAAAVLRGWAALATAPPRPPSLLVLSVSRT
jgi:hypothetical protein